MGVGLYIKGTDQLIFEASDEQLRTLQQWLVAESSDDADRYVDESTIAFLADNGCDHELLVALQRVLPRRKGTPYRESARDDDHEDREGVEIEWRPL